MAVWLEAHLILLLARFGPPNQRAQSMVEYSIIAALIAIAAIGTVSVLGGKIAAVFTNIAGSLP